jgi:flavin-binding protein dodecin
MRFSGLTGLLTHGRVVPSEKCLGTASRRGPDMAESVYKVIELIGTSEESWEKAASAAVARAAHSLRDVRIAEVAELDLQIENGQVLAYRARVKVSFKYEGGD